VDEGVRYFRDRERPVEAMHAHFDRHTYHRHAHETYSFGVTEIGAQAFTCRGEAHTSAAGMVMAFNPDEPHDGWSATPGGFTYRMVHIGPSLISRVLADAGDSHSSLPLFLSPVLADPVLARGVERLHESLTEDPLRQAEVLTSTVLRLIRRGATKPPRVASLPSARSTREIAARTRSVLAERFAEPVTADELAAAADASRYAVYRAFQSTYGRPMISSVACATPLVRNAVTLSFCQTARSSRTTMATFVGKRIPQRCHRGGGTVLNARAPTAPPRSGQLMRLRTDRCHRMVAMTAISVHRCRSQRPTAERCRSSPTRRAVDHNFGEVVAKAPVFWTN
jgi:AraC-like DNA-binding protein